MLFVQAVTSVAQKSCQSCKWNRAFVNAPAFGRDQLSETPNNETFDESATTFLEDLLAPKGLFAGPGLSRRERSDVDLGWTVARQIASLHIGQTNRVHFLPQPRIRFALEGGGDDSAHTGSASALREEQRISTIPGDDSQSIRRFHPDDLGGENAFPRNAETSARNGGATHGAGA